MGIVPPRFACDVMLGRTAKWLRLLGLDTFYDNRAEDDALKMLCRHENRVLLTKDVALHKDMPAGSSRLIAAVHPREQLQEIVAVFQLAGLALPPRCPVCNGELAAIAKGLVKDMVPPYVFRSQNSFQRCRNCQKTYWPGSHLARIAFFLKNLSKADDSRPL